MCSYVSRSFIFHIKMMFLVFTEEFCSLGDSGGPLMTFDNSTLQFELVAVTSARNACTTEGLFTRVAPYNDWISSVLKNPPPILTTTTRATTTTGKLYITI